VLAHEFADGGGGGVAEEGEGAGFVGVGASIVFAGEGGAARGLISVVSVE